MTTQKLKFKLKLISLIYLLFAAQNANAGGYSTSLYSSSGLGNAYAGSATGSHDISDVFFNPAVSAGNSKKEFIASLSYLRLAIDPDKMSSTNITGVKSGSDVHNAGTQKLIPAVYFSTPINNKTAFNLAITSPFGLETRYKNNWVGRYRAIDSSISTLNFNPSFAYKILPNLSVGAGLVAQYYKTELSKESLNPVTFSPGQGRVDGSAWGYGYNLGLKYDINKKLHVGIGYRSHINHTLKGNVSFEDNLLKSKHSLKTATPESLTVGLSYDVNTSLQLVADSTWTRWSRLKKINVNAQTSPQYLSSSTKFNWNNSFLHSLGANYVINNKNLLRTGFAYEQEGINIRNREPKVPSSNKYWLTAGLNHKFQDGLELDVSYIHQIYQVAKINIKDQGSNNVEGTLYGKYNTSVDVVSLAIKKQF